MADKKSILVWEDEKGNDKKTITIKADKQCTMPESKFNFELIRYKDKETHRERLVIKCLLDVKKNGEVQPNGEVKTTIDNLDKAFNEFMQYGVVFSNDNELIKLKRKIKQVYLEIEPTEETEEGDKKLDVFLEAIVEYIKSSEEDNTDDLCYIPVGIFDEIAGDCDYKSYELQGLRKDLQGKEYLHTTGTTGKRIAILVRYQNKPTRVIAFKREKMEKEGLDSTHYKELKAQREKKKAVKAQAKGKENNVTDNGTDKNIEEQQPTAE